MPFLDAADANAVLNAMFQHTNYPTITGIKIRLGSNAGSAGTNMTELTGGSGYTTGGQACTFAAASGQSIANSTTLSWTNSGSAWSIVGIEPWDTAGTPLRHGFGSWTGQPIAVATGNTFAVAIAAITATLA
jgi:hypothetical protein